ncbi:MAG: conjugal transfer protein TraX, partial [Clostridia bacterium]|nr:conjugal transfer protein TraX [Clostridia bacterium]
MLKKFGLTNNQLKIIAMVSMLFDHIGKELLPQYEILQIIGRLAFPIFAFMIAEGCFYTKNKIKYFLTIFILGTGCQIVYFIVDKSFYQNILITFSLSIELVFALENFRTKREKISGIILFFTVAIVFIVAIA